MEMILFVMTMGLILAIGFSKTKSVELSFTPDSMKLGRTSGDDLSDMSPVWSVVGVPFRAVASAFSMPYKMKYFKPSEFGVWFNEMDQETLKALDKFREYWGDAVTVSPAVGALGRHGGASDNSQHNVDKWGKVRAVDFFPFGLNQSNAAFALQCAKRAGFTGIGMYSDTSPSWMMHGDTRHDRTTLNPALWARVDHKYVSIGALV